MLVSQAADRPADLVVATGNAVAISPRCPARHGPSAINGKNASVLTRCGRSTGI